MIEKDTLVFACKTFGYGSPGHLLPVVAELQDLRNEGYKFVGVGSSGLRDLSEQGDYFDVLLPNDTRDLSEETYSTIGAQVDRVAGVYNVNEPRIAMWAHKQGVKNVLDYEMLFPYWQISDTEQLLEQKELFDAIEMGDTASVLDHADALDQAGLHHDLQISSLYTSTKAFILRGAGVDMRLDSLYEAGLARKEDVMQVGTVITRPTVEDEPTADVHVQLSGAYYPIYTPEQTNTYMEFTFGLLARAFSGLRGSVNGMVVCNEMYHKLESAKVLANLLPMHGSVTPQQNANNIAQHRLTMAPPGRMTLYDIGGARRTLMMLPAKHAEQHEVYDDVVRRNYHIPTSVITRTSGYRPGTGREFDESTRLIDAYRDILGSEDKMDELGRSMAETIMAALDRENYHSTELNMVCRSIVGDFEGAPTIAASIRNILSS